MWKLLSFLKKEQYDIGYRMRRNMIAMLPL